MSHEVPNNHEHDDIYEYDSLLGFFMPKRESWEELLPLDENEPPRRTFTDQQLFALPRWVDIRSIDEMSDEEYAELMSMLPPADEGEVFIEPLRRTFTRAQIDALTTEQIDALETMSDAEFVELKSTLPSATPGQPEPGSPPVPPLG